MHTYVYIYIYIYRERERERGIVEARPLRVLGCVDNYSPRPDLGLFRVSGLEFAFLTQPRMTHANPQALQRFGVSIFGFGISGSRSRVSGFGSGFRVLLFNRLAVERSALGV